MDKQFVLKTLTKTGGEGEELATIVGTKFH